MPPPPRPSPNQDPSSLPLDQSHVLLTSFNSFLTVAIHNILYYRNIYPPATFLSTRAYNLPVHQNRHPKVCSWIRDAVDAVAAQLSTGHVARIAVVIHSPFDPAFRNPPQPRATPSRSPPQNQAAAHSEKRVPPGSVLERWLIDTSRFPSWPSTAGPTAGPTNPNPIITTTTNQPPTAGATSKAMRDFARVLAREARAEETRDGLLRGADDDDDDDDDDAAAAAAAEEGQAGPVGATLSWPDLDEQLRGALRRMASVAASMTPLPEGCTFTVAVELDEDGRAPIGHPQAWIPSEPNLQLASGARKRDGEDVGGARTRPIRSVEAGPLFFECWVEEGKAKEVLAGMTGGGQRPSQASPQPC